MVITVTIKNVYGNEMVYPYSHHAKIFAALARTKTLTHDTLSLIKTLGYTIKVKTGIDTL